MNRSRSALWTAVVTMCLLGSAAVGVSAQTAMQDFVLINKTGVEIHALYVTPQNSKDWGGDILGADTLPAGEFMDISFSRRDKARLWDLRVEDGEGEFIEWGGINLFEISSITLHYNNGKATAVFDEFQPELNGTWVGHFDDGSTSPYVWQISNSGASISVENIGGGAKTSGRGSVKGNAIRINNFATPNGKVSAAGDKITWSDGVVWKRVPELSGEWVGYYDDGTRSPFRWSISQSGIGINIQDAKGGAAKSRGTLIGLRVTATDFATKNGTLSADGQRITWSDGIVWVRE